jgi:DNA-directed RNA polymerase specialized sigma24 family protein
VSLQGSVTDLIELLKSDDQDERNLAAHRIWGRYFQKLLVVARGNLSRRVRRREDEEDVLLSMYKSFCLRQQRGEFELASRDDLWKLLVTITLRKARNTAKKHKRERRDVTREALDGNGDGDGERFPLWALEQMSAADPSPEDAALLKETLEQRLQMLVDPRHPGLRRIAELRLEGYSNREISTMLGCTERLVERRLARIRSKWSSQDDPAER